MPTEAMAKDGGKAQAFVEDSATQIWLKTAISSAQYFFNGLLSGGWRRLLALRAHQIGECDAGEGKGD